MPSITVIPWSSFPDGQEQFKASGMDKHGGYHDFFDTTEEGAYEGCLKEIEEANEE